MYHVNTFSPLASSKTFCKNKKEIFSHLSEVVKKTNELFKTKERDPLKKQEIQDGCNILKLDLEENPDLLKVLGRKRMISLHNLTGESPPEDYKDLFLPIEGAKNAV